MKRRGFTLVELTVVLAIIVVASGLIIARVGGWSSRQGLASSARTLGNMIRTYRERAELEEAPYLLALDLDKGTWSVAPPTSSVRVRESEAVAKGGLRQDQRFGVVRVGGLEQSGSIALRLAPRGILPKTEITIENGAGEKVRLILGTLTSEVEYDEAR